MTRVKFLRESEVLGPTGVQELFFEEGSEHDLSPTSAARLVKRLAAVYLDGEEPDGTPPANSQEPEEGDGVSNLGTHEEEPEHEEETETEDETDSTEGQSSDETDSTEAEEAPAPTRRRRRN